MDGESRVDKTSICAIMPSVTRPSRAPFFVGGIMKGFLSLWLVVALANPDTGERDCGYWGDIAQADRNEAIAWEATRAYTRAEGGLSKNFVRTVVKLASGEAATLPTYTYDYAPWFLIVPLGEVRPGHILQLEAPAKRSAIIVDVGADGWVEVIGSRLDDNGRSGRVSLDLTNDQFTYTIYEIGTGMCSD